MIDYLMCWLFSVDRLSLLHLTMFFLTVVHHYRYMAASLPLIAITLSFDDVSRIQGVASVYLFSLSYVSVFKANMAALRCLFLLSFGAVPPWLSLCFKQTTQERSVRNTHAQEHTDSPCRF